MMLNYCVHNEVLRYWLINITSTNSNPENQNQHLVFKGKTLDGALKSAQRYCNKRNQQFTWQQFAVGEVLYECDYYGRKVNK